MKIGLVGNPNVGKSTIFNNLTGLRQHTGNWPGKTVEVMTGYKIYNNNKYEFIDLPGTYSLISHSKDEEVTRDFIFSGSYDALIIVCDATNLERNLNLVIQTLEIASNVIVCINLVDEASKKGIIINYEELSQILNVPIVPVIARDGKGINKILEELENIKPSKKLYKINYGKLIEDKIESLNKTTQNRSLSIKQLLKTKKVQKELLIEGFSPEDIETIITEARVEECSKISNKTITYTKENYNKKDIIIDKIVTGKITGCIGMIIMLMVIFWITIAGANYPSELLYNFFFTIDDYLENFLQFIHIPSIIINFLIYGVYRVMAWVISVMLPPMAIFFPLFTLLEDFGYLPRVAFNLDNTFQKSNSCGKQALTMSMGFGCNAVGVMGTRIIDSKRERLIAILTNCFVPCNGRYPMLITLITLFIVTDQNSILSSLILTLFIIFSIIMTFIISKILSKTILKGESIPFTLELPPYRKPKIGSVIIRSILDRTLFVLKRAVYISIPAGAIIWLIANTNIHSSSLLQIISSFLDPFGHLLGLDGVIILAFLLGFPANEIIIPIIIMGYMSLGYITDFSNLNAFKTLLINNNWTITTAICMMIFTLIHFPCLTTVFTIKKETKSIKYTILSVLTPLITGIILCTIINLILP